MVASNIIYCVLVLMTTTITLAFCIKFKNYKNFMEKLYVPISIILVLVVLNELVLPVIALTDGAVKVKYKQAKPPKVLE